MLGFYIFILFVLFTVLLICSLVLTLDSTMATEWATNAYNEAKTAGDLDNDKLDTYVENFVEHIKEVGYALIIFTLIIGMTMGFGWCYRNSTSDKTF